MGKILAPTENDVARFWSKVDRRGPDECWPWIGRHVDRDGYGRFHVSGMKSNFTASRVAWAIANGKQPSGMVCHRCDNPPCCNPAHLWVGTNQDNQRDSSQKGRARGQSITHCVHGHPYTPENTYWRPGTSAARDCRACIRGRGRSSQQRKATA